MKTLVAIVTDSGFLVPSLVVARQLVGQGIHEIADIVIYTVNVQHEVIGKLGQQYAKRIRFEALNESLYRLPPGTVFHKNHVPATALGRLCLHEVIPAQYENIVYLDGDVQIVDAVAPLIAYRVPDGKILAGRGSAWLDRDDGGYNLTPPNYLNNLGGVAASDYFNSGVLAFRRDTWTDAAPKALKYFFDNSERCLRHDQSALNAVFKGRVVHFQSKYNFHSIYAGLYVQKKYKPAIIHFTGPGKPWRYGGPPWGERFRRSYVDALRDHPVLADFLLVEKTPLRERAKNVRAALRHSVPVPPLPHYLNERRQMFFDYARSTHFPF
jgi:lipopolysaccharide biosynthesis glycosyltransferase